MTKDELKDRISMALKDPILQQGFEIICKENAKLKEEVKNNEDLATVAYMQGAEQQKKKANDKLAKAKEIMRIGIEGTKREFIFEGRDRPFAREAKEMLNDFVVKAEQFLNGVSE